MKRHTIHEVSEMCHISEKMIWEYETGQLQYLTSMEWVCLASYYGKQMLTTPFTVHQLEMPFMEVYFMYIRNGEPVQYAAKMAFKKIVKEGK